jgi:hypothetical protein
MQILRYNTYQSMTNIIFSTDRRHVSACDA